MDYMSDTAIVRVVRVVVVEAAASAKAKALTEYKHKLEIRINSPFRMTNNIIIDKKLI